MMRTFSDLFSTANEIADGPTLSILSKLSILMDSKLYYYKNWGQGEHAENNIESIVSSTENCPSYRNFLRNAQILARWVRWM